MTTATTARTAGVDAGVETTGAGEIFFGAMAREIRSA